MNELVSSWTILIITLYQTFLIYLKSNTRLQVVKNEFNICGLCNKLEITYKHRPLNALVNSYDTLFDLLKIVHFIGLLGLKNEKIVISIPFSYIIDTTDQYFWL